MYNGNVGKKRKIDALDIIPKPELLAMIHSINSSTKVRDKALVAFVYLTGARISEILGTIKCSSKYKKSDISKGTPYKIREPLKREEYKVEPLKKESVEVNFEDDIIRVYNVICLKRKFENIRRTIPIIISQERPFVDIFLKYYNTLEDGQPLFKINRQRAWQIMNKNMVKKIDGKEVRLFNHFMIHERCSHLAAQKNFNPLDLQKFRGWRNTSQASVYAHLNTEDLANKMRGSKSESQAIKRKD